MLVFKILVVHQSKDAMPPVVFRHTYMFKLSKNSRCPHLCMPWLCTIFCRWSLFAYTPRFWMISRQCFEVLCCDHISFFFFSTTCSLLFVTVRYCSLLVRTFPNCFSKFQYNFTFAEKINLYLILLIMQSRDFVWFLVQFHCWI